MPSPLGESPEFRRLLEGAENPSLLLIALEIACDAYADLDIGEYLRKVDLLVDRIRERCVSGSAPRKIVAQINWALFVEEGFEGNRKDYFDPRNSYMNEVIDRKTGNPITLSVLYRDIANHLGVSLEGANLPAHFMLRLDENDRPLFIDPFHSGELLELHDCVRRISELSKKPVQLSEEHLAPCPSGMIVARMLRNLKAIYLGTHDFIAALPVQRRLTTLLSDDPLEKRDLGMLCFQVDRPGEAIDPLESYLETRPEAEDAEPVRELLRTARKHLAQWN